MEAEVWSQPVGEKLGGVQVLETEILLTGDVVRVGNMIAGELRDVHLQ